jgi:hypothetical protein
VKKLFRTGFWRPFSLGVPDIKVVFTDWPNAEKGWNGPGFQNFPLLSNGVKGAGCTNGAVRFCLPRQHHRDQPHGPHLTVPGQAIAITQPAAPPIPATQRLGNGAFQLTFTGSTSGAFTVRSTTNLLTPLTNWTVAGTASNAGSGRFQFTTPDPHVIFKNLKINHPGCVFLFAI